MRYLMKEVCNSKIIVVMSVDVRDDKTTDQEVL